MTEFSLEVMSHIDPALVEEVELLKPRRRTFRFRAAVIAACLCLALVGTGMAAVANGWIRVSNVFQAQRPDSVNNDIKSVASVTVKVGGLTYIPWENFSQQAHDFVNSFMGLPGYKGFDSWKEAEEFLGLNIADNPVLETANPSEFYIEYARGTTDSHNCIVGFDGRTDSPSLVTLSANYKIERETGGNDLSLSVYASFGTVPPETDEKDADFTFVNCEDVQIENYCTPSGVQAVIMTAYNYQFDYTTCRASFQVNGIRFILHVFDFDNIPEQTVATVKEVLDAFA